MYFRKVFYTRPRCETISKQIFDISYQQLFEQCCVWRALSRPLRLFKRPPNSLSSVELSYQYEMFALVYDTHKNIRTHDDAMPWMPSRHYSSFLARIGWSPVHPLQQGLVMQIFSLKLPKWADKTVIGYLRRYDAHMASLQCDNTQFQLGIISCRITSLIIIPIVSVNSKNWHLMMTSSNGSIFRVTGLCVGHSPVTGAGPPVMRRFDVFFIWINCCQIINGDAGDLRRHHAHFDVTVIYW